MSDSNFISTHVNRLAHFYRTARNNTVINISVTILWCVLLCGCTAVFIYDTPDNEIISICYLIILLDMSVEFTKSVIYSKYKYRNRDRTLTAIEWHEMMPYNRRPMLTAVEIIYALMFIANIILSFMFLPFSNDCYNINVILCNIIRIRILVGMIYALLNLFIVIYAFSIAYIHRNNENRKHSYRHIRNLLHNLPTPVNINLLNREPYCIICMDSDDTSSLKILQCSHIFHVNCITEWLTRNSTCPVCRVTVIDV